MFNTFKHLLPDGRAWRITAEKTLRRYIQGLTESAADIRAYFGRVYFELLPEFTTNLSLWERQFGLYAVALTDAERRERLAAAWQAQGGQDPRYIQDTLQGAGFPVFVHEWWEPGTEPPIGQNVAAVARDPNFLLRDSDEPPVLSVTLGGPDSTAGNDDATAGFGSGRTGYPLVNKVQYTDAGVVKDRIYEIPTDPDEWRYFWYVGAETFAETVTIPLTRRDEFEALLLKIGPSHLWIGVFVEYS